MDNKNNLVSGDKLRSLVIAGIAILLAALTSLAARFLVSLIDFFTNLTFHGTFSIAPANPTPNSLGLFVIVMPVIGGLIVGFMALYGSKAIRGHGIPEVMERILTNQSRIKPSITILKPLSAAISIGTGGPFGAEGPIIATGSALGSTLGQLLKITHYERKILLAAGAAAGMSTIFGTPLAAIFLAIELLLFEFSPRSIIPISLASITGAAGHHFLFAPGPVFPLESVLAVPDNSAIAIYSMIGIVMGLLSVGVTKSVYLIEDGFEKLPIHWRWWPAIGGIVVGVIGYFGPRTLGVGYNNIVDILAGTLPMRMILSLCLLKFLSWAVSLGSGTSGGTLAPLLTIGGASGALMGSVVLYLFPESEIVLPVAALVGMAAMFAGASRAVLTSIIFGLETTWQFNGLLPLLAGCTAAYFISYFFMKNTIMTEKIARRGIKIPHSYESDILERLTVGQVMKDTPRELPEPLSTEMPTITSDQSVRTAAEKMANEEVYLLMVLSPEKEIIGVLTYKDIINSLRVGEEKKHRTISLKRYAMKMIVKGNRWISTRKK